MLELINTVIHCLACGNIIPDNTDVGIPFLDNGLCEDCDKYIYHTCPACQETPIGKGEEICKKCLLELQADAVYDLPINHSDEWKEWVDFEDDEHTARVADSDIPF